MQINMWCCTRYLPDPGHVCLIYDLWHRYTVINRHLACHTWYMTYVTGTWYLHWHTVFNADICHAIFGTDICHAIFNIDTCHARCDMWLLILILSMLYLTCDTRPRYLSCYTYHLTLDTHTWYVVLDSCSWHTVYAILSCGINTWTSWLLTEHYHPWCLTIWHIHDYHCYGDMTWLLYYYYQIFGTPELLYSCILDPLK